MAKYSITEQGTATFCALALLDSGWVGAGTYHKESPSTQHAFLVHSIIYREKHGARGRQGSRCKQEQQPRSWYLGDSAAPLMHVWSFTLCQKPSRPGLGLLAPAATAASAPRVAWKCTSLRAKGSGSHSCCALSPFGDPGRHTEVHGVDVPPVLPQRLFEGGRELRGAPYGLVMHLLQSLGAPLFCACVSI